MRLFVTLLLAVGCNGDKPTIPEDSGTTPTGTDSGDTTDCEPTDELCDGVDNDCDGDIDEGVTTTWYQDADLDGYGTEAATSDACEVPEGYAATADDCDDQDAAIHPDAEETDCTDDTDYNCDGSTEYDDVDGDGWAACEECDDGDSLANPGLDEVCDGIDNDCDGEADEADAVDAATWYYDGDADGYGDDAVSEAACDPPADHSATGGDCDDTDAAYNPGATDDCTDPNDYNCDGSIGYADVDGDGWAACEECDDNDASQNPDALETCATEDDDDCDGTANEDDAVDVSTWYGDTDGDGYGDAAVTYGACAAPTGYLADSTDCDDTIAEISPAGTELCDDVDNDCDTTIDEDDAADAPTWYQDDDGDDYGSSSGTVNACDQPEGYAAAGDDCDDLVDYVHPGADEVCDDVDNDCDGGIDGEYSLDATTYYADSDGDGFGDPDVAQAECAAPDGYVEGDSDCDDTDRDTYPGATEYCDGADDNCDGVTDEDTSADASTWYLDADSDTYGDAGFSTISCYAPTYYVSDATDCDDAESAVNPAATELCDDADNDCDTTIDEDDAADAGTWYADVDQDTYGSMTVYTVSCDAPTGYVSDNTDCDDAEGAANPGATEFCDGFDNDCDSDSDEDSAADASTWYLDADGDEYGVSTTTSIACNEPSGYAAVADDCDDGVGAVNPGATETCNGIDDDCDSTIDEDDASDAQTWYLDADGDTYGNHDVSDVSCEAPTGYVSDGTDCDDSTSLANPGAIEVCEDGIDNDCNGEPADCELSGEVLLSAADHIYQGDVANDYVGNAVSMGDINGDGQDDAIVGSPGYDVSSGLQNAGRTFVMYGPIASSSTAEVARDAADITITGAEAGDNSGDNITAIGDMDGDGDEELFVGARRNNGDGTDSGAAYLFYGNPTFSAFALGGANASFVSTTAYDYGGYLVADAGDIDDDGYHDILTGAYAREVSGVTDAGVAAIFYAADIGSGEMEIEGEASVLLRGDEDSGYLGFSGAGVGDVNADGVDDYVIGAYGAGSTAGEVYLILGTPASDTLAIADVDAVVTGATSSDRFGYAIAGLGDVDGDGHAEWAVGADYDDATVTNGGAVYVFSGSVSTGVAESIASAQFTGEVASDYFGRGVSGPGDVNGDGSPDLLVAATAHDQNASGAGAVYLFGDALTSASASESDAVFYGTAGSDAVGYLHTHPGDIDGDGYMDVGIGAPAYDPASVSAAGSAWFFFGSGI